MWSRMAMNAENNNSRPTCGNTYEEEDLDSPPGLGRALSPLFPHFPALDWVVAKKILLFCALTPLGHESFY